MLQKFLFVGVGGSGGVTLRALRALLLDYLAENGYPEGIPATWQFVHIDVPLEQDRKPERIPLLPKKNYVGLGTDGLSYSDVDDMLCARGDAVVRYTTGWRPNPKDVNIDPVFGAGQFRAVGRVMIGARMEVAHERLSKAVAALSGEEANEEFSRVCLRLTGRGEPSQLSTQVVVIASLAGGSGSGLLGDVCDMLGQLVRGVDRRLVAVLYTPQVFDDLLPADRAGINPNALGAVCELLNGRWNNETSPGGDAFLEIGGAKVTDGVQRHGPTIPYMIGKSNGAVTFADQGEVYEAVARGLTVWTTSAQIQERFSKYEIGNWSTHARSTDRTGLAGPNTEQPLSSFGCASVGIGLERFARYSVDRLTREAVEHVLSGHWRTRDEKRINEEEARRQRVEVATAAFLESCGLDEKGPHRNEIIDSVRGGMSDRAAQQTIRTQIKPELLARVREAWPPGATAEKIARRIMERIKERWPDDFTACQDRYVATTAKWTSELQEIIQQHTANLIATEGLRVAVDVLRQVITELTETVIPELQSDLDVHDRMVKDLNTRVSAALATMPANAPASHPRVEQAVDAAIDCFHSRAEMLVHELAVELVRDITENLLTPLRTILVGALEGLQVERSGTFIQPSPVPGWPQDTDTVPQAYFPARNELVLEKVIGYPAEFARLICAQVDDKDYGNAVAKARHETITGISEKGATDQLAVGTVTRWTPRDARLRQDRTPTPARFSVNLGLTALRDRARRWIRRPDTPIARHLDQTLDSYLAASTEHPQAQQNRLENFRNLLTQAVKLSRPLITIDPPALMRAHDREIAYREVMTPLPFVEGHPGREAAREVFATLSDADFLRLFGESPTERIDIFTFLDRTVQPSVMSSLTYPINAQWNQDRLKPGPTSFWTWRRARPLPSFLPCAPKVRRNIVRGWFAARFLNQVRCSDGDPRSTPTEIWTPQGYQAIPFPLLGRPIRRMDEWLPAVMESMALVVAGASFAPYQRLAELGASLVIEDELSVQNELASWLEHGRTVADAPIPEPTIAGGAKEPTDYRAKLAVEYADKYREHYVDKYCKPGLVTADSYDLSRAWELRDDILEALTAFRRAVDAVADAGKIDMQGIG